MFISARQKCNNAPFGNSSIRLFKGNRNDLARNYKSRRPHLLAFLKGSQQSKRKLKEENPALFTSQKFGSLEIGTWWRGSQVSAFSSSYHATKMSAFTQSAEKVNLIKSLCGTLVDHPFRIYPFLFQTQSMVGDSHVTDARAFAPAII